MLFGVAKSHSEHGKGYRTGCRAASRGSKAVGDGNKLVVTFSQAKSRCGGGDSAAGLPVSVQNRFIRQARATSVSATSSTPQRRTQQAQGTLAWLRVLEHAHSCYEEPGVRYMERERNLSP
ncbi:hypothetical protein L1887_56612 [Cichorium endivia]|nr:hypothetical protein L1887_56612 [Cichorium endivia]